MAMSKKAVTFGTDLGAYLRWDGAVVMDWDDLITNGGIDFFMCKSGEENPLKGLGTLANLKAARDHDLSLVGTYPWFFPGENPKIAISRWLRDAEKEKPDFCYIDAEQITNGDGKIVEPQKISDNLQQSYEGLKSGLPELVVDVYCNANFVQSSAYPMKKWMGQLEHPMKAGWPDWGLKSYELDWMEFRSGKMRECLDWDALEPRPWRWISLLDGTYEPDFSLWTGVKFGQWLWQFSSRILPKAYQPGSSYRHQYDFIYFNGDLATMKAVMKKQTIPVEKTMASTYDPLKSMEVRAPMIELSSDNKTVDMKAIALGGTSAVIVRVAGEDGTPVPNLYADNKAGEFLTAAAAAGIPSIGEINLRAGYYLDNQKNIGGDGKVKGILDEAPVDNPILKAALGALRSKAWTFPTLKADDGGWFPFYALMFNIWDWTTKSGGDPGDTWQAADLSHAINPITDMMAKGQFPKVPIWILTNGLFITHYDHAIKTEVNSLYQWLYNHKDVVKLGLTDPTYTQTPAATPMTSIKEVWDKYRPTNEFKFGYTDPKTLSRVNYVPFGWEFHWPLQGNDTPVWFHYYTTNRFPVPEITGVSGKPMPINGFLFSSDQETLYKHLNFVPGEVIPPEKPPVENEPTTLKEAIELIIKLQARNDQLDTWMQKYPFLK